MEDNIQQKRERKLSYSLIALCWIVYACAYLGKLSYNANISQLEAAFGATHSQSGLVGTMFFFAYGVGQVFNGLMCKKYNIKYVIFSSLVISSLMNLAMNLIPDFAFAKYIWLINGAATSFLWASLIRLLSETLGKKYLSTAIVVMGTTVATGTVAVYAMSSLFVAISSYRVTFFVACGVLASVAIVWMIMFDRLSKPLYAARQAAVGAEREGVRPDLKRKRKLSRELWFFFGAIAIFAVANNFIKYGLTSWTPSILNEMYATPDWLSILLTLALPVVAIPGVALATAMHKRIDSYVLICTLLYTVSTVLIGTVILLLSYGALTVTVVAFALVSCFMGSINSVITGMIPLRMRDKVDSGKTAGLLNGFCYVGSTLSMYGLGYIAENNGWSAVMYTLLALSGGAALFGAIHCAITVIKAKSTVGGKNE